VSALSNSWELSKRSFRVVEQDKELLLFPLIAGLLGLGWIAALAWPLWTVLDRLDEGLQWTVLEWVLTFVLYLGLSFVSTVSSFCMTYTTKCRFEGNDASFGESLRFTCTRLGPILLWSVARATVGLLLHLVDKVANSLGAAGERLLHFVERTLDGLWEIVTVFVVPVMVYEGVAPGIAFKISAGLFKQTWGERLVKQFGFAWVQGLCMAGVFTLAGGLAFFFHTGYLLAIPIAVALVGNLAIVLLFEAASAVYDTALYVYATEQRLVGFDERQLAGALQNQS
jgi:hypothetical protein